MKYISANDGIVDEIMKLSRTFATLREASNLTSHTVQSSTVPQYLQRLWSPSIPDSLYPTIPIPNDASASSAFFVWYKGIVVKALGALVFMAEVKNYLGVDVSAPD
jgi:hypothetical protein